MSKSVPPNMFPSVRVSSVNMYEMASVLLKRSIDGQKDGQEQRGKQPDFIFKYVFIIMNNDTVFQMEPTPHANQPPAGRAGYPRKRERPKKLAFMLLNKL